MKSVVELVRLITVIDVDRCKFVFQVTGFRNCYNDRREETPVSSFFIFYLIIYLPLQNLKDCWYLHCAYL